MMNRTTHELEREIRAARHLLQRLRDQVKVQIHLAELDAKEEWEALQPSLEELESTASDFTDATHAALQTAVARLKKIRASIAKAAAPRRPQ